MKFTSKDSGRLNKILANIGLYSRREVDKIIEGKKIYVNNILAKLGQQIKTGDTIDIKEENKENKYFLYYKKQGEVTDKKIFISGNKKYTLSPTGRLDKESEGVIFYSNDNIFIDKILSPENETQKEYIVKTREPIRVGITSILKRGVETQEGNYKGVVNAEISKENPKSIKICLIEGKKHEIRRMLNALGLTITNLKRVRIANWKSNKILPGKYIELSKEEIYNYLDNKKY